MTPEQALAKVRALLGDMRPQAKPEHVWSVVHHEYGTWLHLDVFDLNKQPTKPARKYTRKERYRYCAIISMPVCEAGTLLIDEAHPTGRCKDCTQSWRCLWGYGSEDDLGAIDDLPSYKRKEQM